MAYSTIDDPSAHFHVQTYSGSGSSGLSVTNDANAGDFKPDVLWVKRRDSADNLAALDSSRGNDRRLKTNSSDAEDTDGTALFTFETDGFDEIQQTEILMLQVVHMLLGNGKQMVAPPHLILMEI